MKTKRVLNLLGGGNFFECLLRAVLGASYRDNYAE